MGKLSLAEQVYDVSTNETSKILCDNIDGYLEVDGVFQQVFLKIKDSCDREQMLQDILDEFEVEDIGDLSLEDTLNEFLEELKVFGIIKEN